MSQEISDPEARIVAIDTHVKLVQAAAGLTVLLPGGRQTPPRHTRGECLHAVVHPSRSLNHNIWAWRDMIQ
jgi:hypothetical protein